MSRHAAFSAALVAVAGFFLGLPAQGQVRAFSLTPAMPVVVPGLGALSSSMISFSATPALSLSLQPSLLVPSFTLPDSLREGLHDFRISAVPPLLLAPGLVRQAGASDSFTDQVRAQLAAAVPATMLSDVQSRGYIFLVKDHITQGRSDLDASFDNTGGLTDWGELGNFIMIAERIKNKKTGEWMQSKVWRNAAVHECGHALDNINGFTDSPEYRQAWREDFEAMSDALKRSQLADGSRNDLYYFLDQTNPVNAYRETFAEAFDVLMRGEESSFNYENFRRYFPKTLVQIRQLLEARYGPLSR